MTTTNEDAGDTRDEIPDARKEAMAKNIKKGGGVKKPERLSEVEMAA